MLCEAGQRLRRRRGIAVARCSCYCAAFTLCSSSSSMHVLTNAFVTSSHSSAARQDVRRRCHDRTVPLQSSAAAQVTILSLNTGGSACTRYHPLRLRYRRPRTHHQSSSSSSSSPPPLHSARSVDDGVPPSTRWKLFDEGPTTIKEYVAHGPYSSSDTNKQINDDNNNSIRQERAYDVGGDAGAAMVEEEWLSASGDLAASLGINPTTASEAEHRRVFHLYLPVYFWLNGLLQLHRDSISCDNSSSRSSRAAEDIPSREESCSTTRRALVVGVSAPQGCGKSTLVGEMRRMLEKAGHPCAVVSVDDFYLTGAEQDALAARHPTNPLLQVRGNAGTHDLALGLRTLRALSGSTPSGSESGSCVGGEAGMGSVAREGVFGVCVPRYDKSARGGRGDRAPEEEWEVVSTLPEIVLLEGWMLGFDALPDDSPLLAEVDREDEGAARGLELVNKFLRNYEELHDEVDAWLVLQTADPEMVFEWRAEAERRMREAGLPGMSEDQVRDFCSRYMPAYRAYLPGLYDRVSTKVEGSGAGRRGVRGLGEKARHVREGRLANALAIEVGRDRNPIT